MHSIVLGDGKIIPFKRRRSRRVVMHCLRAFPRKLAQLTSFSFRTPSEAEESLNQSVPPRRKSREYQQHGSSSGFDGKLPLTGAAASCNLIRHWGGALKSYLLHKRETRDRREN